LLHWMSIMSLLMSITVEGPTIPEVVFPGHGGIGADFNVDHQKELPWRVTRGKANVWDRCYLPGQAIELALQLSNPGEQPVTVEGTWRWVWVGDERADGRGGVRYVALAEHSREPLERVTILAHDSHEVAFTFPAPDRHGVLALFLDANDGEQRTSRWVTNVAVLFPVAPGQREASMLFGDCRGVRDWQRAMELPVLRKLGVKWVRVGEDWGRIEPRRGEYQWGRLDSEIQLVRDSGMFAIYLGGSGSDWTRAYGNHPWPRGTDRFSASPDPSNYGALADFYEQLTRRFGHTIRAINVWNEPWELGGISGWGGTGLHYRDLQRAAFLGARRGDPTVLVGGNDSDNNIYDNLMSDPAWRDYTSLLTVHGGGFPNQYIHRRAPDEMPIWNTEHWYTAWSDMTVQEQLFNLVSGRSKTNLVILGNFFTAGYRSGGYFNPRDQDNVPDLVPQPNAAAYNAMAHLLEGMRLVEEVNPGTLPYLLLFERVEPTTDEATHQAALVIIGQHYDRNEQIHWQANGGTRATAIIPHAAADMRVLDRFGHRHGEGLAYPATRVRIGTEPIYVVSDSLVELKKAASGLTVEAFQHPVQIAVMDPLEALRVGTTIAVRVTNAVQSPRDFTVDVTVPAGFAIEPASFETGKLAPGQTHEATLRVVKLVDGEASLPVTVRVRHDAAFQQADVSHTEVIGVRQIHRFTPAAIDANLDEWIEAGIKPLVIRPAVAQADAGAIAPAMPWEMLADQHASEAFGRWALAYDDAYLYVMAELHTPQRGELPWDQTRDDWFELQPGGHIYRRIPQLPCSGEQVQLALNIFENQGDWIYPQDDPRHRRYPQFRTDYLLGFYETRQGGSQAWLYRRPGGLFRHRYPFSPMRGIDQQVAPGVQVAVQRDEAANVTRFEAAVPLALLPELDASPSAILHGAEVKLVTQRFSGLYSAAGRGAAKKDQSVFQPYWATGYTTDIPWRFGPSQGEP
jgi:hypothetical protein